MDFAQGVGTFQAVVLSVQEIFVGVSGGGGEGGGEGGYHCFGIYIWHGLHMRSWNVPSNSILCLFR